MAKQSSARKRKWIITATAAGLLSGMGVVATGAAKSSHFEHHHVLFDPAVIESLKLQPKQQTSMDELRRRVEAQRGKGWTAMRGVKALYQEERDADGPNLRRVMEEIERHSKAVWAEKAGPCRTRLAVL